MAPVRILTVCLGNICRSPLAEAAIRTAAERASVAVEVDSAGTGAWHVGNPPDSRSVAAGRRAGLQVAGEARKLAPSDLADFDLVVTMDESNFADVTTLQAQHGGQAQVRRLRSFDPDAASMEVADPYYGGEDGFDRMVAEVLPAADGVAAWAAAHARA